MQTQREHDDSELDDVHEDLEPSLGSVDVIINQTRSWSGGVPAWGFIDAEEDSCEDEPAIASPENSGSQESWACGSSDDSEEDPVELSFGMQNLNAD